MRDDFLLVFLFKHCNIRMLASAFFPHPSAVVLPLFQTRMLVRITIVFPGDEATRLNQVEANPIRKVVTLLQDMQKELEAEGKKEEDLYNKFMCYCTSTS